jgi:hypothetical protein
MKYFWISNYDISRRHYKTSPRDMLYSFHLSRNIITKLCNSDIDNDIKLNIENSTVSYSTVL